MSVTSETHPGWRFRTRWRLKLFLCHGCGVRMRARNGVLTLTEGGLLQWACLGCYQAAYRRAAT